MDPQDILRYARAKSIDASGCLDDGACLYTHDGLVLLRCYVDIASYQVLPSCRTIAERAFAGRNWLVRIDLPEGLERIGDEAFFYCGALRHADLPESLESIGDKAFYCSSLAEVRIPASVRHIGDAAFATLPKFRNQKALKNLGAGALSDAVKLFSRPNADALSLWFRESGSMGIRDMMKTDAEPEETLRFTVDSNNPRVKLVNDFVCEDMGAGDVRAMVYAGSQSQVIVPKGVTCVCDYTLTGAFHMRTLSLPASLRIVGEKGLALTQPLDRLSVDLPTGETMMLYPAHGLPGMYACNRALKHRQFDAWQLANQCDASLAYTRESNDRLRRIVARIDNGVMLTDAKREQFLSIVMDGLDSVVEESARKDDLETLRMLVRIGAVNKDTVAHAIDVANQAGAVPACRLLMEESRRLSQSRMGHLAL